MDRKPKGLIMWALAPLVLVADLAGQLCLSHATPGADAVFFGVSLGGNGLLMLTCLLAGDRWPGRIPGVVVFSISILLSPVAWGFGHLIGFRV